MNIDSGPTKHRLIIDKACDVNFNELCKLEQLYGIMVYNPIWVTNKNCGIN